MNEGKSGEVCKLKEGDREEQFSNAPPPPQKYVLLQQDAKKAIILAAFLANFMRIQSEFFFQNNNKE